MTPVSLANYPSITAVKEDSFQPSTEVIDPRVLPRIYDRGKSGNYPSITAAKEDSSQPSAEVIDPRVLPRIYDPGKSGKLSIHNGRERGFFPTEHGGHRSKGAPPHL
jgi:hypothetical protein